jgi:membrane-associated phospholipid phosphatase
LTVCFLVVLLSGSRASGQEPAGPFHLRVSDLDNTNWAAALPEAAAPRDEVTSKAGGRFGTGASLPRLAAVDLREVLGAPLSWKGPEWRRFSLAMAGIGAAALLDGTVRDADRRVHSRFVDRVTNTFEPLGSTDAWVVLGLFYAGGVAADDSRARATAVDGVLSTAIASGIVTSALKTAVGRKRPHDTGKTFDFAPFSGNASFPSGHSTHAFAVASVIATHYDSYWIKGLSYGSAAIVAYARIHHQAHFLSDVTTGAVIGTAVGRSVVHHNQRERSRYTLVPAVGPRGQPGVALAFSF